MVHVLFVDQLSKIVFYVMIRILAWHALLGTILLAHNVKPALMLYQDVLIAI